MIGELIREFSKIDSEGDVKLLFGTVLDENPFSVFIDERFTLKKEHLIFPSYLNEKALTVTGSYRGEGSIGEAIKTGDVLILLSVNGQYLVIGKAGDYGGKDQYVVTVGE